jgi:hypothetical protein
VSSPTSPSPPPAPPPPRDPAVVARNASYALLAFTTLTTLAVAAWFGREDQPWGFASFVALLSALLGAVATTLMWRRPTREHAIAGLAVMGLSLVRVGNPIAWATPTIALVWLTLIAVTTLLAIPVAQAVIVLPRS